MKRIIVLLLALLLSFSFAACADQTENSSLAESQGVSEGSKADVSESTSSEDASSEDASSEEPDPLESLDMSKVLFNEPSEEEVIYVRCGTSVLREDKYGRYMLKSYIEENEIPEDAYLYLQFDMSDVEILPQYRVEDLLAYLEGYGFIEDSLWAEEFFSNHANITKYKGEFTVGYLPASAFGKIIEDDHAMYFAWRTKPEWVE